MMFGATARELRRLYHSASSDDPLGGTNRTFTDAVIGSAPRV